MARELIDKEKLRAFVREQKGEALLILLDRAIDLLPRTKLPSSSNEGARAGIWSSREVRRTGDGKDTVSACNEGTWSRGTAPESGWTSTPYGLRDEPRLTSGAAGSRRTRAGRTRA